jgi:Xaa-Pro aminopeptidase
LIVSREAETILVIPELERPLADRYARITEVRTYRDRAARGSGRQGELEPTSVCSSVLMNLHAAGKPLGFETAHISHVDHARIVADVAPAEARDISNWVPMMRSVKDADEIALIEEAAEVAGVAREAAIRHTQPGTTETELVQVGLSHGWGEASRHPDRAFGFFGNVIAGPRSDAGGGHDIARGRPVEDGDLVFHAWGASCESYWAMAGRSMFVGSYPPDDVRDAFKVSQAALSRALDLLRPGVRCSDVYAAADELLSKSRFDSMCPVILGAGIGLAMNEMPRLASDEKAVLRAGMILRVGYEIYLRGKGTVTSKCLVRIQDAGPQFLIEPPESLLGS